jgi:hypothetical protein
LAPDFNLPLDAVTQTFAILAKRGVGKTYTALVLVEELLEARAQVLVADPVGVCWGLRAAANGKDPGLPIIVLGGEHGDVPLEATAGKVIAEFVVETRSSVVLDLALFRKGDQVRFMTDFAETLYHRNRAPLHLVLDEADAFAPQRPMHGQERMLGAIQDLVRRGRARGIGVTLVTQRAAVLSKDVLTQVEVLVALRTIAPQDRDAIDAWIQAHDAHGQRGEFMASLASLPIGTAWFWSPGWLDVFRKVKIRARTTFDSSATPKVGETAKAPKRLAPVDLEALKGRITATIERAKAEDPRELRRQVAELKAQLAHVGKSPTSGRRPPDKPPKPIEIPVLSAAHVTRLEAALRTADRAIEKLGTIKDGAQAAITALAEAARPIAEGLKALRLGPWAPTGANPVWLAAHVAPTARPETVRALGAIARTASPHAGEKMPIAERKILSALAQYEVRTKVQVAIIAGYAHSGGGFNNALSACRTKGWLAGPVEQLRITDAGVAALGPVEALPTGRDLAEHWLRQLGKAERLILITLLDVYPQALTKEVLGEKTGYAADGGGFNNACSRLRTLELINGRGELRANAELVG